MDGSRSFERRIVTVLFADLVGFTTISEGLDPEDVATIQDAYFDCVRGVMQRHGAQLEKFIGDAAMAVFGLPRGRDDDAERGVAAGLALIGAVEQLSARLGLEAGTLRVRIGINTGEVFSAESGPDLGRVTGDVVNVAARLQAAAQPSQVLVGDLTAFSVAASVELEAAQNLLLKGKAEPVRAAVAIRLLPRPERSRAMGSLRSPLVGRDQEFGQLMDAIRAADRPTRWLILALPGVGKSRLLTEVADDCARAGILVWRADVRLGGASAFEPVAQLLLAALGRVGSAPESELAVALRDRLRAAGLSETRAEVLIEESLTLLRPAESAAAGNAARLPGADRDERFAAWLETLRALEASASAGPTVWLIEDLHWAEPDLLAFLDVAVTGAASRAILCTTRPALVERVPEWCAERLDQSIRRLDLEPLEPLDAGTLVQRLVGDALAPDLVERIVDRSDGNALFIEELLRSWISVGMLVPTENDRWRLSGPPDELSLPSTVQAIYAAQLDDLPANARRLARRASVAGRRFFEPSLVALDSVSSDGLEELRSRALLVGPQEALLGATYGYRHVLLRDAGYASLARLERADLHVRLARWLEQAAGDRAALIASEIAQHYAQALDVLPALSQELPFGGTRADLARVAAAWLERAAEQALRTSAHQTAAALLRQALDLTPDDDHPVRARRWLRLAEAIGFTGDMDEALSALAVPIDLYEALLDGTAGVDTHEAGAITARDGYARAVALRGTLRIEQLQFKEAEALADRALQHLGGDLDDLATARLLHLRAWARMAYSADADAEGDLERARAIASTAGERQLEFQAGALLADLEVDRGEVGPEGFLAGRRRMFDLAMELGEFRRAGSALRILALTHAEEGGREAADLLAQALQLAEAHGLTEEVAWCHYASAEVALITGDWDAAWQNGLRALEIGEGRAYHRPIVRTWFALTAIAHAQGRTDEMVRAFAWFDARRNTFPDSPFGRIMHGAVDARAATFGLCPVFVAPDSFLDAWNEAPGLPSWYAAIELVLDGWLNAGRHDLVTAAVARMQAWEQLPLTSALARASSDLMGARLQFAAGDASAASGLAERSLGYARTVGAPWWIVRALRARQMAGEPLSAQELDEATAIERRLGLPPPLRPSSPDGGEAPRQSATSGRRRTSSRESPRSAPR